VTRQSATGIAQSVQARLQAKANREGRPYAELLQFYGIERFLYRLARSKHRDSVILKGAFLFRLWLGLDSRPTRDIDLLGPEGADEQAVRQILLDIVETEVEDDGLELDAESIVVRRIRPGSPVQGMRAKLDGYLGRSHLRFQVDVGLGDAVVPQPEEVQFQGLLDLPVAPLKAYTIYSMVAEKLEALAFLGDDTSRVKDFYDLFVLPRELSFDGVALTAAIQATFDKRESSVSEAVEVLRGNSVLQKKSTLWEAFLRKSHLAEHTSLEEALGKILAFIDQPARAVVKEQSFEKIWKPGGPWQEPG
jgi:hypothetical protein